MIFEGTSKSKCKGIWKLKFKSHFKIEIWKGTFKSTFQSNLTIEIKKGTLKRNSKGTLKSDS